jgi:hypothetical protein
VAGSRQTIERLPPVRLAPRDELAALARVAPLLRAARDLSRWTAAGRAAQGAGQGKQRAGRELSPARAAAAAAALDLAPREVAAAWRVAMAIAATAGSDGQPGLTSVLADGGTEDVLAAWDRALAAMLESEDLDGIATALYTVGAPVGMDGLFEAYASAAALPEKAALPGRSASAGDHSAVLSQALETLADLGVVELGMAESDGSLTVTLSPLGIWGIHRRLRAQGWHVPVIGASTGARGLLAALASCDAEDGETEIAAWLAKRPAAAAAAELIEAAATGSPGQRGAAFAVLDRIGLPAIEEVKEALDRPLLRAHAAVWLLEHGLDVRLDPADRTWLLVDLGAGLLEEAEPRDVVGELLPDLPAEEQAEIVAGLWQVNHPGVTGLLTALSEHHPDPAVARAARKASFKARSPAAR